MINNMIIMDGRKIKENILNNLKIEIDKLKLKPSLTVIQVGNDEASNIYVRQKKNMAAFLGYTFNHISLEENITEEELLDLIDKLNKDKTINGILVQMPLPKHIDEARIQNKINEYKDVDGLTDINSGRLFHNKECLLPCTPYGIMELLDYYNINVEGKNVTIIGKSNLVGKPLSMLMLNKGATVTICHSKTKNISELTKNADILVVAVGKRNLVNANMVKDNAIVIDVGINRDENNHMCGDVDFENVKNKTSYITPVPYGVGQLTVAMLGVNVYKAYMMQNN